MFCESWMTEASPSPSTEERGNKRRRQNFFTRLNQGRNCQTSALLLLINNECINKVQWDKVHAIRKRLLSSSRYLVLLSDSRLKLKDELLDSFGVMNPLHHGNGSCCYNSQANFYCSVNTLETAKLYEQPWFWMAIWINSPPELAQNVQTYSMSRLTQLYHRMVKFKQQNKGEEIRQRDRFGW